MIEKKDCGLSLGAALEEWGDPHARAIVRHLEARAPTERPEVLPARKLMLAPDFPPPLPQRSQLEILEEQGRYDEAREAQQRWRDEFEARLAREGGELRLLVRPQIDPCPYLTSEPQGAVERLTEVIAEAQAGVGQASRVLHEAGIGTRDGNGELRPGEAVLDDLLALFNPDSGRKARLTKAKQAVEHLCFPEREPPLPLDLRPPKGSEISIAKLLRNRLFLRDFCDIWGWRWWPPARMGELSFDYDFSIVRTRDRLGWDAHVYRVTGTHVDHPLIKAPRRLGRKRGKPLSIKKAMEQLLHLQGKGSVELTDISPLNAAKALQRHCAGEFGEVSTDYLRKLLANELKAYRANPERFRQ